MRPPRAGSAALLRSFFCSNAARRRPWCGSSGMSGPTARSCLVPRAEGNAVDRSAPCHTPQPPNRIFAADHIQRSRLSFSKRLRKSIRDPTLPKGKSGRVSVSAIFLLTYYIHAVSVTGFHATVPVLCKPSRCDLRVPRRSRLAHIVCQGTSKQSRVRFRATSSCTRARRPQ